MPLNERWIKSVTVQREALTEPFSASGKKIHDIRHYHNASRIATITNPPDDIRLKRRLLEIQQECSTPGWNGHGAKPLCMLSVNQALNFLEALPKFVSYPDLVAEPNGQLAMVWTKNGFHLIVGISRDGRLAYGGKSPAGRIFGDVQFTQNIPLEIIDVLAQVEGRV